MSREKIIGTQAHTHLEHTFAQAIVCGEQQAVKRLT
jgi:hypothetical protein